MFFAMFELRTNCNLLDWFVSMIGNHTMLPKHRSNRNITIDPILLFSFCTSSFKWAHDTLAASDELSILSEMSSFIENRKRESENVRTFRAFGFGNGFSLFCCCCCWINLNIKVFRCQNNLRITTTSSLAPLNAEHSKWLYGIFRKNGRKKWNNISPLTVAHHRQIAIIKVMRHNNHSHAINCIHSNRCMVQWYTIPWNPSDWDQLRADTRDSETSACKAGILRNMSVSRTEKCIHIHHSNTYALLERKNKHFSENKNIKSFEFVLFFHSKEFRKRCT